MRSGACVAAAARMRSRQSGMSSFIWGCDPLWKRLLASSRLLVGLALRVPIPFTHRGQREQRLDISTGRTVQDDPIAPETESDRTEERVDDSEATAQKLASGAKTGTAFAPDRLDASDVSLGARRRLARFAQLEIHAELLAQGGEARVHFRRHATRPCP